MKKLFVPLCFLVIMNGALGNIEDDGVRDEPTKAEIARNHACFEELSQNGCRDPGEDPAQFRTCLSNVFPTLSKDCQKMMSSLYGQIK